MAKQVLSDLDFNSASKITNLPDPTAAQHAATKAYVDAAVEGLAWKDSTRVGTQSNLNLSSPGATIDGVTMATNDRVLVRNQTTASQNGVYVWNGAAVPMTRAADGNTFNELEQAVVSVEEGTDAGTTWRQTAVNGTIDVSTVTFSSFGTAAPSASETTAGIAEIATQTETDTGTDDLRMVTPLKLATYAGRKLKYATDIGDGSATSYTVTHNLGTRDVSVFVRRNSGNYDQVLCDVNVLTTNTVQLVFAVAPTTNLFRCIVLG